MGCAIMQQASSWPSIETGWHAPARFRGRTGLHWVVLASLVALVPAAQLCSDPSCWRNKVVYQVLTDRFARSDGSTQPCDNLEGYCGGSWRGIIDKLDYIVGLGVDAIWISPVVDNVGGGYHGYWARSTTKVNSEFGTEADLKELISTAHNKGLLVMADAVANHMGSQWGDIVSMDPPFNDPGLYHHCAPCLAAGGGQAQPGCKDGVCNCWVQNYNSSEQCLVCQLYGLPDLNQSQPTAHASLLQYAAWLREVGFDAVRLDTVLYVPRSFWVDFRNVSASFNIGEVATPDDARCVPYIASNGMDATLNYPLYYTLKSVFTGDSRASFRTLAAHLANQRAIYGAQTVAWLGNFASNHDNPRLPALQPDAQLRKNFALFPLAAEGLALIYYGEEQAYHGNVSGDASVNREPLWTSHYATDKAADGMYDFFASVNALRQRMPAEDFAQAVQYERYVTDSLYVFMRGQVVVALTNGGSGAEELRQTVGKLPWRAGTRVCNLFNPVAGCLTVQTDWQLEIVLEHGEPKLYAPSEYMPPPVPQHEMLKTDASATPDR